METRYVRNGRSTTTGTRTAADGGGVIDHLVKRGAQREVVAANTWWRVADGEHVERMPASSSKRAKRRRSRSASRIFRPAALRKRPGRESISGARQRS